MGEPVAVGDAAPAFDLEGDDGERVRLADFAGKPVVLYFYPRDDTPGCTKQAIGFTEKAEAFAAAGAVVIGVSKDDRASHEKFKAKHDLTIKLASDPEGETIQAYGSWVEKNMYGKKYMGIDRSTFLIGADGALKEVWRKVRIPGHVDKVLKAVEAL